MSALTADDESGVLLRRMIKMNQNSQNEQERKVEARLTKLEAAAETFIAYHGGGGKHNDWKAK